MKKFRVSQFTFKLFLVMLIFPLAGGGICAGVIISNLRSSPIDIETIRLALFGLIVSLLTMVLAVYEMLWDFPGGAKLTVTEEGLTMWYRGRDHFHRWDEFVEWGIEAVDFGSLKNPIVFPWVYFSTFPLSAQKQKGKKRKKRKKRNILGEIRPRLKDVVCFEYTQEIFEAIQPHIPERWREEFLARCKKLGSMEETEAFKTQITGKPIKYRDKYPISRNGWIFPWIGMIVFGAAGIELLQKWLGDPSAGGGTLMALLMLAVAAYCAKWCLFEFLSGTVRMDAEGITIRIGLKKRRHRWEELTDYGIVAVSFSMTYHPPMFWAYASRTPLTAEEKIHFKKHRHEIDRLAYFECKPGPFFEMLRYIPPECKERLWQNVG